MTHAQSCRTHARVRRTLAVALSVTLVGAVVSTATAQVEVPTRGGSAASAAPSGSAAPAPQVGSGTSTTTRQARTVVIRLRVGSRGAQVRRLQQALRRRAVRVAIDGVYGPGTRRAVIQMQRRMGMRPTGIADTPLLRRLGLQTRVVASAPASARPAGLSPYLKVFPVLGDYTYINDFGAPRHQGAHQGIDVMADKGTPLVAVVDATVDRVQRTERGLGGIYVWLKRADGTDYYYAHMHTIAAGLQPGQRVTAGQVIGTVGNTGDARGGADHLHFEIRLRGNRIINPYTHLVAVDPNRQSASAQRR